MKYVVRRAVAGVVITPLVACAWVLFYGSLVGLGFEATALPVGVFLDGLGFGVIVSACFVADAYYKLEGK